MGWVMRKRRRLWIEMVMRKRRVVMRQRRRLLFVMAMRKRRLVMRMVISSI